MTPADLVKLCEKGFESATIDSKREGLEISSGGPDVEGTPTFKTEPAALYATEALALSAWLTEFNKLIDRKGNTLIWVEKPYVESYHMTLSDQYHTFRVVMDRYVARGTVAVEPYAKPEPEPEETPLPAQVLRPGRKAKAA